MLRTKKYKRFISLLCTICMLFSLFVNSVPAFASEDETPSEDPSATQEAASEASPETIEGVPEASEPEEPTDEQETATTSSEENADVASEEEAATPASSNEDADAKSEDETDVTATADEIADTASEEVTEPSTEGNEDPSPADDDPASSDESPEDPAPSDSEEEQPAPGDADADPAQEEPASDEQGTEPSEGAADNPEIAYNEAPIKGSFSRGGVTVKVTAPSHSFPEGTSVSIKPASNSQLETIKGNNRYQYDAALAFDIVFLSPAGERLQPSNGLKVKLEFRVDGSQSFAPEEDETVKYTIYHVEETGTVKKLKARNASPAGQDTRIVVQASQFSPYIITKTILSVETEGDDEIPADADPIDVDLEDPETLPDEATEEDPAETDPADVDPEDPETLRDETTEGDPVETDPADVDPEDPEPLPDEATEGAPGETDPADVDPEDLETLPDEATEEDPADADPLDVDPEDPETMPDETTEGDPAETDPLDVDPEDPVTLPDEMVENDPAEMDPAVFEDLASVQDEMTAELSARGLRNGGATSTNLTDFLVSVQIDAPTDEQGNYIINPNSNYEMTLRFKEKENLQFADEETLVYHFPNGVVVSDLAPATFTINLTDQYGTATISGTYEIVNGELRVRFDQNDPNFERLKASPNADFSITIASSYAQGEEQIEFAPGIVKEFVFDDSADLSINKRVRYDQDEDTASYELTISSEGLNENVVIEDRLTGTALIFNQDVTIESNINGVLSVTPDYTSVENGFRVTIPQTVNGEIITLRYSATVDNTKISSNGTVEQTNNTARVTSDQVPDGKEASANFAGQANFQRVAKRPVGEPSQIAENLYTQEWKIRVNEDHKLPMGDADISDWIVQNSRPFMQFDGEGLSVVVTFEDGSTETRVVPWSELYVWEGSTGKWGWRYHTPETDGNASYEITCTTLINTNGALGDLSLVNGAQVYGSYDEGTTTIGVIGENEFDIQKDALGTTSTESEWAITVTVPGSGLDEMHVVDDAPKLTYEGQSYIDYPLEDSFEVEGLLEGESWRFHQTSDRRSFTVTFYKSGTQNEANKGLLPTPDGQPRNIVIRYRTQVNQEWLDLAAEDGYSSSTLYRHRNYAAAWSNSYRTQTVDASVVPIRPELVKNFIEQSDVEIDGVTYPVFRYSLTLLGPVEDGIVIQDSFPTEYLKLYEAAGIQIRGWSNSTPANGNGTVSASDTTEGVAITVSSFPKQNDGSFYSFYMLSYSLIPKDQDALNALNAAAAASQNGIDLENIARWDILESSSTANYTYYPYVDKELLTRPTAENGYVAEFQIIINKYADDLDPTSDVLAIQDVLSSNLRFIPDSLTISPANDSIMVQHNDETNTLTFTEVPDETTFVITYQARVLGQGSVTYSNTVSFGKYEKTIEESATVSSSGGGSASNPSITLVKRDADSISTTLAGATFQLFYMQDGSMIPVVDRNGNTVSFTTGPDGSVLIVGNQQTQGWALWAGRTYCLVELAAPTGYELLQNPAYFVLSETPSSQLEYDIVGDQFSIQNTIIRTSIPVNKQWIGPAAQSATINLLADGEVIDSVELTAAENWQHIFTDLPVFDMTTGDEINYKVEELNLSSYSSVVIPNDNGSWTIINTNTETIDIPVQKQWVGPAAQSVTISLSADGEVIDSAELTAPDWQHTFTDLPKYDSTDGHEIAYAITEDAVSGYAAEIAGDATAGFTITNTNTATIDIPVEKQWVGAPASSVTITLTADGELVDTVELTAADNWLHTFLELPKYDSTDGHAIAYDVQETPVEGYTSGRSGTVETGFTFTNTITGKVSIPVTKAWIGPATESVTVNLMADGVKVAEVTLSDANNWQHTFTDLEQYNNGVEIVYEVEEVALSGYSSSITSNDDGSFTIVNTNTATIDIPVQKQWVGEAAESVTINLLADGAILDTVKLTAAENWRHTFTDIPKYDSVDGHEIVYDVTEEAVAGYDTLRSGTVETGFTFTNTNTETIDIPVQKQWVGEAAESVTINLLADGAILDTVKLTTAENWRHTFTDLPKYDSVDGHEIVYDVTEEAVAGYDTLRSGDVETGFTFTNTITGKVSIPVTKRWIGPAAKSITVILLSEETKVAEAVLNDDNHWQHTFEGLDMFDGDGVQIKYTVQEVSIAGYNSKVIQNEDGSWTIINTNTDTIDIPVKKQWVGPAAESVTITLTADGAIMDTVKLTMAENWQHTFTDLLKYDSTDGHEIVYDVTEEAVAGYDPLRSGDVETGFTFTNTNTSARSIAVEKRWEGTPRSSATVRLLADDVEVAHVELNGDNSWKHTFGPVPRYDAVDGHEIVYTVTEDTVSGYTTSIAGSAEDGFVVTNTKKSPEKPIDTPKTGDTRNLHLYLLAMLLSAGGLVCVGVAVKRRKKQQ